MLRYDEIEYLYVTSNQLTAFHNYCNCGGYAKKPSSHQSYCNQYKEVMNWYKSNRGNDQH